MVTPEGVSCDPKACSELHCGVLDSTSGVFPMEDEEGGGVAVVPGLADSSLIPAPPAGPGDRTGEEQSPVCTTGCSWRAIRAAAASLD